MTPQQPRGTTMSDEKLYLIATNELDFDNRDEAVWAKSMALHKGDEHEARYKYISTRVEQLATENASSDSMPITQSIVDSSASPLIEVAEFANFNGISVDEAIWMINDGMIKGEKRGNIWFTEKNRVPQTKKHVPKVRYEQDIIDSTLSGSPTRPDSRHASSSLHGETGEKEASELKYIVVWLLAGFACNILVNLLDTFLVDAILKDESDFEEYSLLGGLFSIPIVSGAFILIYNFFDSLNMKKVMIYVYVLGSLGTLINIAVTTGLYSTMNVDLTVYYFSSVVSFLVALSLIRNYYIKKPERWY